MLLATDAMTKHHRLNPTEEEIANGLRKLAKVRLCLFLTILSIVPLGIVGAALRLSDAVMVPVGFTLIALAAVVATVHGFWPCPACGKFFNMCGLYGNPLTSKCLNCGIPLSDKGSRR